MPLVSIGIGSNIAPEQNLCRAAAHLRTLWPDIRLSSVFKTAPMEFEEQSPFLNAAATFLTDLPPQQVLQKLQNIEKNLKKSPPFRFGPRTIDLDLLLYDNDVIPDLEEWKKRTTNNEQRQNLSIPHLRMHQRRFVLEPLCELVDRNTVHPVLQTSWAILLQDTLDQQCDRTSMQL